MCTRSNEVLCQPCTAEIYPTWFWWKDVPTIYRLTADRASHCADGRTGKRYIKALSSVLKPGKCRAAVIFSTTERRWCPCGHPVAEGDNACKRHQKILDKGDFYVSGVSPQYFLALSGKGKS